MVTTTLVTENHRTNLRVGADRCVRPRVSVRIGQLLMFLLHLPGGCIAFVPISPDVTKIPVGAGFGLAGLSRNAVLWVDHPRWSRRVVF
jgi:hypothetical protein